MNFSIRATIRGFVAPDHVLACSTNLWRSLFEALVARGLGRRESGAFLLGTHGRRRQIRRFVLYDDLDLHCLDSGIVRFDGAGYGPLWAMCRETGLSVVADVHTHPGGPYQSGADRTSPMIAKAGHLAIIVPNFAMGSTSAQDLGLYRYRGQHEWDNWSLAEAGRRLYIGRWG